MLTALDREMGFYAISVPTSQALESLANTGIFAKDSVPVIESCETLMVNLRTLVRNAVNAFGSKAMRMSVDVLVDAVRADVEGINDYLDYISSKVRLEIYYCDYDDIPRRFPNAILKTPHTERQVIMANLANATLAKLRKEPIHGIDVLNTDWKLSGVNDTLLLTHYYLDLLSAKDFPNLRLIESHTGTVKTKAGFHTKLKLPKGVPNLPLNGLTIQVFGDGTLFAPQPKEVKKEFSNVAVKREWHALTTETRMFDSLQLTSRPTYDIIRKLTYK